MPLLGREQVGARKATVDSHRDVSFDAESPDAFIEVECGHFGLRWSLSCEADWNRSNPPALQSRSSVGPLLEAESANETALKNHGQQRAV